jgi:glycerol-3-phosphate O-acyltransferase
MARALTAKPRRGSFGSAAASPIVVLADVHTPVERGLVAEWAAVEHPGAERLEGDHAALAERLERGDDPLVVPVGVTWLPPERDGDRRVRAADLLALTNPHRPWSWAQPLIVRRDPARARASRPASRRR